MGGVRWLSGLLLLSVLTELSTGGFTNRGLQIKIGHGIIEKENPDLTRRSVSNESNTELRNILDTIRYSGYFRISGDKSEI